MKESNFVVSRSGVVVWSVLVAAGILLSSGAFADSWTTPRPQTFTSKNKHVTFEIVPETDASGRYKKKALGKLVYLKNKKRTHVTEKFDLVNVPVKAMVYARGQQRYVVTFDTWGRVGYAHTLTIYHNSKVVRDFKLENLLSAKEISTHVRGSISSRWWRNGTKITLSDTSPKLSLQFSWGKTIVINLTNGKFSK